ncbi:MAG: thioredoxin-disulfide reductase [bacterium]
MVYKLIIIGSGPAGLTSGIYAGRAKLNPLIIEGNLPGGQLVTTSKVENWPGNKVIMGAELMKNMKEHAKGSGCNFLSDEVEKVDFKNRPFKIFTKKGKELQAEAVVVATGASHRKLNVEGEKEYWGNGVSVCSTCDAPFFKDRQVVVVGSGNTAMTESYYLTEFANKVTIVHVGEKITATDPIKDSVINHEKVEVIPNSTVTKIEGDDQKVTSVQITNQQTGQISNLKIDGVFISIGLKPNSQPFENQLEIDKYGYIINPRNSFTSVEGVFVAGDVSDFKYRQAITASGQGCMAAIDCQGYLTKK